MVRIPGVPSHKASLMTRFGYWYSRRRFGKIATPLTIVAHNPWIARAYASYELGLDRARLVDPKLKALASLKAATLVGCPF